MSSCRLGRARPANRSGRCLFQNLPQTPFSDLNLHFFGSERGSWPPPPNAAPTRSTVPSPPGTPGSPVQTSTEFFTLDSGPGGAPCPGRDPAISIPRLASSSRQHGGRLIRPSHSQLTRTDGDQDLAGLTVSTPPGFAATLAGIPILPRRGPHRAADPQLLRSRRGSQARAVPPLAGSAPRLRGPGAGSHPVYLPGKVYLAGPYKGAPLSLAVITPAVSGPYDLGSVVVRAALNVDPDHCSDHSVSDPLPQILRASRCAFARSPSTSTAPTSPSIRPTAIPSRSTGEITGDQGALASLGAHFQVANCA